MKEKIYVGKTKNDFIDWIKNRYPYAPTPGPEPEPEHYDQISASEIAVSDSVQYISSEEVILN